MLDDRVHQMSDYTPLVDSKDMAYHLLNLSVEY